MFLLADFNLNKLNQPSTTEIEYIDQQESQITENQLEPEKNKQIIKQLDADQDNQLKNWQDESLARFESEKTQRVKKETQAQKLGLSQNKNQKNQSQSIDRKTETQTKNDQPSSTLKNPTNDLNNELPEFTRAPNPYRSRNSQTQSAESALSQILPSDIEFSNATNLNTDANVYYSFYNRVEELFYVRWGERLNYYWNRLSKEFKKNQLSEKIWSTTLEVLLTSKGQYHSAVIFKSSGYKPFDEAAIFAFKDAQFFPNPPKEKIDKDGFIRLHYRLSVHIGKM